MSQKKVKVGTYLDGFVMGDDGSWKLAPRPRKLSGHEIRPNIDSISPNIKTRVRPYIHIEPMKIPSMDSPPERKPRQSKVNKPIRAELPRLDDPKSNAIKRRPQNEINPNSDKIPPNIKTRVRPYIHIEPMKVRSVDTPPERKPKQSKSDKPVKAELSRLPKPTNEFIKKLSFGIDTPQLNTRQSNTQQSKIDLPSTSNKRPSSNTKKCYNDGTPLLVIPPITPSITITGSDDEFLQFENQLSSSKDDYKKNNNPCGSKDNKAILKEIHNLVDKDFKEHLITYKKINDLLSKLNEEDPDKENIVVSPAVDFRRTILNKNLTENLETKVQSPRMKKAVDLYNTMRTDYGVLCTPKLDRAAMDVQQASVTRSLSRRIQKQCLLLQDTPK